MTLTVARIRQIAMAPMVAKITVSSFFYCASEGMKLLARFHPINATVIVLL